MPSSSVTLPAAHADGTTLPVLHELPAGQTVHSIAAVRFVAFEYEPESHGSGADAPSGQYEPATQARQLVCPDSDSYVPPAHGGQAPRLPTAAYVPGLHGVSDVEPVVQYEPGEQVEQAPADGRDVDVE